MPKEMIFLVRSAILLSLVQFCLGSLVQPPPLVLNYHKGALLYGNLPINIIWYGRFTPAQRSIVNDFLSSLNQQNREGQKPPSVSSWWGLTEGYMSMAGKPGPPTVVLKEQVLDERHSFGKTLKRPQIRILASKSATPNGVTVVLTAKDVAVEGFCMSSCGLHRYSSVNGSKGVGSRRFAYIWVGNSETQCPGYCAWPFKQPVYGPQTPPLVAPNGDVGVDGMIINIASMLAATVTNPYGNGFFQGHPAAPLEAASACPGIYGKNAYPGYAGDLLVDPVTGASYNANGINGRKHLLPAIWDPMTSVCSTLT